MVITVKWFSGEIVTSQLTFTLFSMMGSTKQKKTFTFTSESNFSTLKKKLHSSLANFACCHTSFQLQKHHSSLVEAISQASGITTTRTVINCTLRVRIEESFFLKRINTISFSEKTYNIFNKYMKQATYIKQSFISSLHLTVTHLGKNIFALRYPRLKAVFIHQRVK